MNRLSIVVVLACVVVSIGCGGSGSSPTAPTPRFPTVSGSYSGSVTITLPEIPATMTCSGTTVVTQSGSSVNIAPIVLAAPCNMSLPFGQVTIDTTGAMQGQSTGSYNEPSCGVYNYLGSGGFFGQELRVSITMTSATCWNINATIVLSR